MTRHLADAMGLPHLDDLLKADGVVPATSYVDPHTVEVHRREAELAGLERTADNIALTGRDHAEKTDTVFGEAMDTARKIVDLGFNTDPSKAPRTFEVAAAFYKVALDAANSKRDAQLKAKEIMLKQRKLDLECRLAGEHDGKTIDAQAVVIEDRNELIKRMRAEAKAEREVLDAQEAERAANAALAASESTSQS